MPHDYKIVICGDFAAGKTSLVHRLIHGRFNGASQPTIGASFSAWRPPADLQLPGKTVRTLGIWDTAGQERFNSLLPIYFHNAHVILFCHDALQPFTAVERDKYLNLIENNKNGALVFMAITKMDIADPSNPSFSQFSEFLNELHGQAMFYTSACKDINVRELFTEIFKAVIHRFPDPDITAGSIKIETPPHPEEKSTCSGCMGYIPFIER